MGVGPTAERERVGFLVLRVGLGTFVLVIAAGVIVSFLVCFGAWAADGFDKFSMLWLLVVSLFAFYAGVVFGALAAVPIAALLMIVVVVLRHQPRRVVVRIVRGIFLTIAAGAELAVVVRHLQVDSSIADLLAVALIPGAVGIALGWFGMQFLTAEPRV